MKKKNSLLFILLMYSLTMLAQKDITKFMGIPVDGFKKDMIQKLKAKGFEYDNEIDLLTGEFNGEKVNIFVATQSNKVWRIVVADAIERNEHDIKIRFNNLYDQFNDNPKYVPKLEDNDYISEDINLAYEMKVRNKRFEAGFMQMTNPKSPQNSPEKIQQELTQKISEICPAEEFIRKSEKEKEDITKEAAMSRTKPVYPHSHRFSSCSPAVQSPLTRFLGIFQHFQGFPRLSVPFWMLRPLCVSYRLPHASILDIPVLPQAAGSLSGWCLSCVVGIVLA